MTDYRNELINKRILVTGATGLIGKELVKGMLDIEGIRLVLLVRDMSRVPQNFMKDNVEFVVGTVEDIPKIGGEIDYIIHGAGPTSSKFFLNNPVETVQAFVHGTEKMLELARDKNVGGFLFLSTMEVYGHPQKGTSVDESMIGEFLPANARNSYPLSKMLCENLCYGYCKEYAVPAKVLRLTQTFGKGVEYNDGRIFAEFARCVIEGKDIVLKSKGETERCYLYSEDAVEAILCALVNGENGETYTAANPDTYCSIADMAEMVASEVANGAIKVTYELADVEALGYASTLYMKLDVSKLKKLGWEPKVNLQESFEIMIDDMKERV